MATAPGTTATATGLSNFGLSSAIITIACVLLLALLFRGSTSKVTAYVSAKRGKLRLRRTLRRRSRDVLEDVILPGAYGGLTQIDFAILTSGGILCIRAKHCNGTVFGSDDDPQWKNVDGVHQQKFLNPAIQNAGRTRALQNVVPNVPVANLVVFTGSVQLAAPKVRNVIHVRDLDSYISKFVFGPCKIKDWDAVWLTVRSALLTDEGSLKDFRAQLSFS
ncbi:MAG: nuclease-related domain-containing protein [Woeseia sp.]